MASLSDFAENALANQIFRGATALQPTTLHFALFTAAPSDAGGGTEVSGGSYARVAVTANTSNFNAASGGQTANTNAITFPVPSANWGTVTHVGVFDAASSGNLIAHGALTTPRTINNGDAAPSFAAGAFTLTFA